MAYPAHYLPACGLLEVHCGEAHPTRPPNLPLLLLSSRYISRQVPWRLVLCYRLVETCKYLGPPPGLAPAGLAGVQRSDAVLPVGLHFQEDGKVAAQAGAPGPE